MAWPTGSDLIAWYGIDNLSPATQSAADQVVAAAIAHFNRYAHEEAVPGDGSCDDDMFLAIKMESARILSRRASANGAVIIGDVAVKVDNVDPDVERYTAPFYNWPSPWGSHDATA